ncbi:MAG: hypothetical protein RSD36_17420 [Terrisporobacter sp.]
MNNRTFGSVLENLLYISKQKKSSLANYLGYDVSYINKWVNSKNLPSAKKATEICDNITKFIIDSLCDDTKKHLMEYFELDNDDYDYLYSHIRNVLSEVYLKNSSIKGNNAKHITSISQEYYNSNSEIRPAFLHKTILEELEFNRNSSSSLDIIMSVNLFSINHKDKVSLVNMKRYFYGLSKNVSVKIDFLMGFDGRTDDEILNSLLTINILSSYPKLNFNLYNCDVSSNTAFFVIKDKFLCTCIFSDDGECLFSSTSKDINLVNEFYFSLEYKLKNKGKNICHKKLPCEMIEDQTYIQYIMNNELRCLLGSINEFFMPEDLFTEIAERVFGHNPVIINELKKINVFLHNATYKGKLKVLIYESELRKYMSSGCLHFFNTPVNLTFRERERHIEFIEKMLTENNDVEIRLVDGNFVEDFRHTDNPSFYLSKNLKFIKVHPVSGKNEYSILRDNEMKKMSDSLFDNLWNYEGELILIDKDDILERISKSISYTRIISENLGEDIH